jgi:hypothetical protein
MKMTWILQANEFLVSSKVRPSLYQPHSEERFQVCITEKGKRLLLNTLVKIAINNPKSIPIYVSERLSNEGGYEVRQLLENHLPQNHPILVAIEKRLQVKGQNGYSLIL